MKTITKLIKLFTIILALTLALAVSGCGFRSDAASSAPTTAEAADLPTTTQKKTEKKTEKTTETTAETTTKKSTKKTEQADDKTAESSESGNASQNGAASSSNSGSSNSSNSNSSSSNSSSSNKQTQAETKAPETTQPPTQAPAKNEYHFTVDAGGSIGYMYSGTLYASGEVSVYDLLCMTGLSLEGDSRYISAINGLSEFDHGKMSGWLYNVNGNTPMISCGDYYPSPGDNIYWWYYYDE